MPHSKVIIIDYGSQVTQLIARRVREAGVYSEIHSCVTTAAQVADMRPSALILSGGPASVVEADAPTLDPGFLDLPIAVSLLLALGIIPREYAEGVLIVGELGLNGKVRPVSGVLQTVMLARKSSIIIS